MKAVRFYTGNDREIPYRFIIESMDLSNQHNVSIQTMGDIYKVSSYGDRVIERNISGVIPSPGYDLISVIDFYDKISIRNNYGKPITVVSQNHIAHGQIVGMTISLEEGKPGGIVLRFLDMGTDVNMEDMESNDPGEKKKEFSPIDRDSADYIKFSFANKFESDESMERINLYSLSSAGIVFSSKYQVIDSRKNVIYYSENPVQVYGAGVITIEDSYNRTGEQITLSDRKRIGKKRRDMLELIRITEDSEARVDIYSAEDYGFRFGRSVPVEVLNIQASDMANHINYMALSFNGVGYYDDFIHSSTFDLSLPPDYTDVPYRDDESHSISPSGPIYV